MISSQDLYVRVLIMSSIVSTGAAVITFYFDFSALRKFSLLEDQYMF